MSDDLTITEAITSFSKRELGNIKILMIEDDIFLSELVLTKLSEHGCIPYSTPNGEEGLKLAEQYLPHVIILDLMLPGIPGEEVLLKLKATEILKAIPVIVFSNKSGEEDIKNNLANGASEYLVKSSTDLSELPKVILKMLGKK
jgi:DNA-binding response OmpR family regulator